MGYKDSDIKVYGRFWSETTDGRIIDSKQIDSSFTYDGEGVVFSDGTKGVQPGDVIPSAIASGQGSVAFGGVKYDYFTNPTTLAGNGEDAKENWGRTTTSAEGRQCLAWGGSSHAYGDWSLAGGKDAKAYQGGSISLGGSCTAGLSEDAIKSNYMVKMSDSDTYIAKYQYYNNKCYKAVESTLTDGNITYQASDGSILGPFVISSNPQILEPVDELGAPVVYTNNRFCFAGNVSTSIGRNSASFNEGKAIGTTSFAANAATVEGAYSAGFGQNNKILPEVRHAFVSGASNTVQFDKSSAFGWNLKTTRESQTVLGRYNKFTENTDDLLQVGGGNNDSLRYNFFGVRGDGRAYVYKAPSDAKDVVRKQELDTKLSQVSTTYTQAGIGSADFRFYGVHPNGSQVVRTAPGAGNVFSGTKNYTQCLAMYLGGTDPDDPTKYLNALVVDTPTTGVYTNKYATNRKYVDDKDSSILAQAKNYTYSKTSVDAMLNDTFWLHHVTHLDSGVDFNTLLNHGSYSIQLTSVATSCTNIPEKVAGLLEVSSPTQSTFTSSTPGFCYRTQRYTTVTGNVYTRIETVSETDGSNTGWNSWKLQITGNTSNDIDVDDIHADAVYSYNRRCITSVRQLASYNSQWCTDNYSSKSTSASKLQTRAGAEYIKPNTIADNGYAYTHIAFCDIKAKGWFSGGMGSEVTLLTFCPSDIILPLERGTWSKLVVAYDSRGNFYEKTLAVEIEWDGTNKCYVTSLWAPVTEGTDQYTSFSAITASRYVFN